MIFKGQHLLIIINLYFYFCQEFIRFKTRYKKKHINSEGIQP